MSKFVADQLTPALLSRLSLDTAIALANTAILISTVDEHGWPHPAMLSTLEVVARDARNVRLATHVTSRTTRNLKANGKLSLILIDVHGIYYVKGDVLLVAASMQTAPHNAKFNLRVDSVLEDVPTQYENARILTGIQIERAAIDETKVRAILQELLEN